MRVHPHLRDVDLLALVDEELPEPRATNARVHLDACEECRSRYDVMLAALPMTLRAMRESFTTRPQAHAASRAALRKRLIAAGAAESRTAHTGWTIGPAMRWTAAATLLLAGLGTLVAVGLSRSRPASVRVEYDALPIRHVTPGATAEVSLAQLCAGRAPDPQPADPSVRQQVLAAYGMAHVPEHEYELDYLITPALGGANDPRNLWPERYSNRRWNAKVKDQLEELLPGLVCEGKVDLQTAQRDIAADWVEAYKKYFKTDVPLGSS